jgi:translation initiation factor 1
MKSDKNTGTVYSTEHGRMCPTCNRPLSQCECRRKNALPRGDGILRVARETKGRKGKGVTLITGLPLNAIELQNLAKDLKQKCGTGGTVKNGAIEIQGDHRDAVVNELKNRGYSAKLSGG